MRPAFAPTAVALMMTTITAHDEIPGKESQS
ncbi:hypothetical protein M2367_003062 [Aeromonas sp. BIGb0445]|jgi:hypothetical protein|nr:hypothetical protein [Aeromonas sp. BIGb0445]